MAGFANVQAAVVVGIGIDIVGPAIAVGVGRRQAVRAIVVVQAVAVGVNERRRTTSPGGRDITRRAMGFDVVGDAIVVGIDVLIVRAAIAVGIAGWRARLNDEAHAVVEPTVRAQRERSDHAVETQRPRGRATGVVQRGSRRPARCRRSARAAVEHGRWRNTEIIGAR